ncbi:MAG: PHP domain-containing protein [Fibromonadales bacterium]|nr:PHP domain-containing protein [Fibromonadales bacterium]
MIDLHLHTLHSDGELAVEALFNLVASKNISCVSITDHDTFAAYDVAPKIAESLGVELIPGIEVSSMDNGRDVHILGYFCDTQNAEFLAALGMQHKRRKDRVLASLEKLRKLGLGIDYELVERFCSGVSIGRPHIAFAMLELGYVATFQEAFDRYLKEGAPAHCPSMSFTCEEAISLIKRAGGLAVMAHPEYTKADDLIPKLVDWGIEGIEVYNYKTAKNIKKYRKIAKKYNLAETGGSDFHYKSFSALGEQSLSYSIVEELRARLLTRLNS